MGNVKETLRDQEDRVRSFNLCIIWLPRGDNRVWKRHCSNRMFQSCWKMFTVRCHKSHEFQLRWIWKNHKENQRKIGDPISSQWKKRPVTYKRTTIRLVLMSKQRWLRARGSLPDCYQQRDLPPELELHKRDHALSLLLAVFLAFCMKPVLDVLTMVVFHHPSVLLSTRTDSWN